VQINNNDYTQVPAGQTWIHHAWSGDIAAAPSYMPKGVSVDVVGYWFPTDGKGPVGNDLNTVLKGATNPVLAHLFLNYLLDGQNALTNISWNGYMQPLNEVTPQRLVQEQILPPSLMSTVVLPSYFPEGRDGTTASGPHEPALGAVLASRQQGRVAPGGRARDHRPQQAPAAGAAPPVLGVPGRARILWLILLFIVPFYAVLAIAMGRLNQLFGTGRSRSGTRSVELHQPGAGLA